VVHPKMMSAIGNVCTGSFFMGMLTAGLLDITLRYTTLPGWVESIIFIAAATLFGIATQTGVDLYIRSRPTT
jgi:hypothetical protein